MLDIKDQVDKEENEQLRSIPAQRLIEKLSLLKNKIEETKKRWFWELLQNASDYNETVNVKLEVSESRVTFSHDGAPFSLRDALNLISPDSNKQDDKIHKDNIGKFGTGLVSTHILSSVLEIEGLCMDDAKEYYKFNLSLDRSCFTNKQPLIEQITSAKESFKQSLIKYPYEAGFNTSFSYILGKTLPGLSTLNALDIDLQYLYEALPYTLCFMPKVQSVTIEDKRNLSGVNTFRITREANLDVEKSFIVAMDADLAIQRFAYFSQGDVSAVFRYEEDKILPYPQCLSRLFCGLPLVGTEDIGMPFILNSMKFMPTTEREGVELQPGANDINRGLFQSSITLYEKMLDYVVDKKLKNVFHIARMRNKYNGNQASNQQFQNLYLAKYKQHLLSHNVVMNADGQFVSFSSILLPFKESKPDIELYQNSIMLNHAVLPIKEEYANWFEVTDFTIFREQKYNCEDFAKQIETKGNIYSFGKTKEEVVEWLYQSVKYLKENDRYIFSRFRLLPNQTGELCAVNSSLYADLSLPNELKDIYDSLFAIKNKKIGDRLLHKQFNSLEILNNEFTIAKLSKEIDEELSLQHSQNHGNTALISPVLSKLYSWIDKTEISKEELASYFHWYYPKRATLIVDMLSESQREQALIIAQSGKMESLSALAASNLTNDELQLMIANIKRLPAALALLANEVDDRSYADSAEGDVGEDIVYNDLRSKYPSSKGYSVVWASRDRNEPCYDFEILHNGQIYCYCDAKTTRRGINNADSIPFFMRKSQWKFLESLNEHTPYYVARVFLADNNRIEYLKISL